MADTGINLRIKDLCREKGIGISELADKIGMSRVSIGNFIARRQWPSSEAIKKIAEALDVPVSELFAPSSNFTALIRDNGKLYSFDNKEDLRAYLGPEVNTED